jgi:hypothetical protein
VEKKDKNMEEKKIYLSFSKHKSQTLTSFSMPYLGIAAVLEEHA